MHSSTSTDNIKISDLRLFLLVAREGSVREVSRKERIEPGRLSKTIRKIEISVGAKLFLRSSAGLSLTPRGEHFAKTASAALGSIQSFGRGQVSSEADQTQDESILSVGAPTFLTGSLLARIVPHIGGEFPDTRLRLLNVAQDQMVSSAIRGVFDVALHVGELDWPRSWSTVQLGKQRSALYARVGHTLKDTATVEQVRKYPFIVPVQWLKNRVYYGNDGCPLPLAERKIGAEVSTADIAVGILSETNHVAFLPDAMAHGALKHGKIRKIEVKNWEGVTSQLNLSVKSDRVNQKIHRAFVRELKEIIGQP